VAPFGLPISNTIAHVTHPRAWICAPIVRQAFRHADPGQPANRRNRPSVSASGRTHCGTRSCCDRSCVMDTTPLPAPDDEDTHTIGRKSARRPRIELITRGEHRRVWTREQKREIVLESLDPGTTPTAVARKHAISSPADSGPATLQPRLRVHAQAATPTDPNPATGSATALTAFRAPLSRSMSGSWTKILGTNFWVMVSAVAR
jgi:hypothetical protein